MALARLLHAWMPPNIVTQKMNSKCEICICQSKLPLAVARCIALGSVGLGLLHRSPCGKGPSVVVCLTLEIAMLSISPQTGSHAGVIDGAARHVLPQAGTCSGSD